MGAMTAAASPSPRPSASIVIACVALTLSGIAVGILIGRSLGPATPVVRAEDGAAPQVDLGLVLGELRKIEDLLARRTPLSSGHAEQAGDTRAPATPVDTYADRLDAEINRLKSELDSVWEQRGPTTPVASRWKAPGYLSLDAMFAFVVAGMKVPEGETGDTADQVHLIAGDEVVEALIREHVLWTQNDVFDRYGTPSQVRDSGTSGIEYLYSRHLDANRIVEIGFQVKDGMVMTVWAQ